MEKAWAHLNQHEVPRARLRLQQLLQLDPQHFAALHLLGVLCGQDDSAEESLDLLTRACVLRPHDAEALTNLGNALASVQRYEEALARYDQALSLQPRLDSAQANRRRLLELRGEAVARLPVLSDAPAAWPAVDGEMSTEPVASGPDHRPGLIVDALARCGLYSSYVLLDLGCAMASRLALLRPLAEHVSGIDPDPQRLLRARAEGRYDALMSSDVFSHLRGVDAQLGMVIAAGRLAGGEHDLAGVLRLVYRALLPAGVLAIAVDNHDGDTLVHREGQPPACSAGTLSALAQGCGYLVALLGSGLLQHRVDVGVRGHVAVLIKPRDPE